MRSLAQIACVCGLLLVSRSAAQLTDTPPKKGPCGLCLLSWQVEGTTVATEASVNFVAGPDTLLITSNPPGKFQIQIAINTADLLSRLTHQAGTDTYCRSTTGDDSYKCALSPSLLIYTPGSCLVLMPDTANTGAASLDVDTLGPLPVLTHSGGIPTDGDIPANLGTLICLNSDKTAWSRP